IAGWCRIPCTTREEMQPVVEHGERKGEERSEPIGVHPHCPDQEPVPRPQVDQPPLSLCSTSDSRSKRLAENNLSVCGYFSAVFSSQHLSWSGQYFGAGLRGHIV